MSAEGEAFAERYSPYRGAAYMVHLRMGILANEAYDYRVFMRDEKMCELCKCSPKTLQRVRNKMIEDGYLERIKPAYGRQSAEYVFLFPGLDGHIDHLKKRHNKPDVPNSRSSTESLPINRKEVKRKSETAVSQPPPVDISVYEQMRSDRSENGAERARQLREIAMGNLRESSG